LLALNHIVQLACIISLLGYYLESYTVCFICGFLWGLADSTSGSLSVIVCSIYFEGQIESFAIYRLIQGLTVTFVMVLDIILQSNGVPFYVFILLIVLF